MPLTPEISASSYLSTIQRGYMCIKLSTKFAHSNGIWTVIIQQTGQHTACIVAKCTTTLATKAGHLWHLSLFSWILWLCTLIVAGIDTLHERQELLTAKFFKRQVLASSSLLHSLLPDRRDNDITSSLRNAKPFYSFRTWTNRFRKSFLPFCLDNCT